MEIVWTLLVAAISLVGGGVLGYFFGLRRGKKLLRHERAAEVLIRWRLGIHEILSEMAELRAYKNSAGRDKFSRNVTRQMYELRMYGLDNESWLDESVRRKAWHLTDRVKEVTALLLLDVGIDDTTSSFAFNEAMKRADDEEESIKMLLDDFSKEIERLVGTSQRPWWRRVFGESGRGPS